MKRVETFNADEAAETFREARPDATERSVNIFRGKAERHLSKDYKGSRGLKLLGLGDNDCDSSVVMWVDADGIFDTMWCVTVYDGNDAECFDSDEALGYNGFLKQQPFVSARKAEINKKHLEEKRTNRCEE